MSQLCDIHKKLCLQYVTENWSPFKSLSIQEILNALLQLSAANASKDRHKYCTYVIFRVNHKINQKTNRIALTFESCCLRVMEVVEIIIWTRDEAIDGSMGTTWQMHNKCPMIVKVLSNVNEMSVTWSHGIDCASSRSLIVYRRSMIDDRPSMNARSKTCKGVLSRFDLMAALTFKRQLVKCQTV